MHDQIQPHPPPPTSQQITASKPVACADDDGWVSELASANPAASPSR
jgi:hypothetical protein